MAMVRRARSMAGGMGVAALTLAALVAGAIIAIATPGGAALEASAEGAALRRPAAECRWELVEIGAAAGWRGVPEPWAGRAPAPLVLLDQCSGETWQAALGPSGLEWREVPGR